jgi:hypothetical protein
VAPDVHYPDLVSPSGWPYFRQELQIRIVPPGSTVDTADAALVVSPLVPRLPTVPTAEALIEEAISAEERDRLEVERTDGPKETRADSGLAGIFYDVLGYVRPRSPRERRLYVMFSDELCHYAVSYLAWEEAFERHVAVFWQMAHSVRPFHGSLVLPSGPSPIASLYSD